MRGWSGRELCGRCWGGDQAVEKMRGSLHWAVHDKAVNGFGRDDASFPRVKSAVVLGTMPTSQDRDVGHPAPGLVASH
jgi:hypothetical protein